jgi:hypothetical protein
LSAGRDLGLRLGGRETEIYGVVESWWQWRIWKKICYWIWKRVPVKVEIEGKGVKEVLVGVENPRSSPGGVSISGEDLGCARLKRSLLGFNLATNSSSTVKPGYTGFGYTGLHTFPSLYRRTQQN